MMFDHAARNREDQSQPAAPLIERRRWCLECRRNFAVVSNRDDGCRSGAVALQLAVDDDDAIVLLFAEHGSYQ